MVGFGDIWSDKLETGIPHIDDHHRKIVHLLIDVHNASAAGGSPETVKAVLADLLSYTKYHFAAEERLMLEVKYPRLGEQRVAHQWFAEKLQTHFLGISAKSLESTRELFAFLRSWYGEHILKLDMDLAAWVREHGKD